LSLRDALDHLFRGNLSVTLGMPPIAWVLLAWVLVALVVKALA
jgi:hypothetical protein